MILKSFIVEKNIALIEKYFISLIYGENIGMKDDIKNGIKNILKNMNKLILIRMNYKNYKLLDEQIIIHLC